MDTFITLIQAIKLTLRAVLKWAFSKLSVCNVGRSGVGLTGDCLGQVVTTFLKLNFSFDYPGIFLNFKNVLEECHEHQAQ